MDRNGQHIVAAIEDRLRAVAVMNIDIEDGDPLVFRAQMLGGERGVVEIAETAGPVAIGMMPGRPAQRVGDGLALEHQIGGGQRGEGRGLHRPPGSGGDRAGEVHEEHAGRPRICVGHAIVLDERPAGLASAPDRAPGSRSIPRRRVRGNRR